MINSRSTGCHECTVADCNREKDSACVSQWYYRHIVLVGQQASKSAKLMVPGCSTVERELLSLPCHLGGLSIINPTVNVIADFQYDTSTNVTSSHKI